jgi:hypothetical protein
VPSRGDRHLTSVARRMSQRLAKAPAEKAKEAKCNGLNSQALNNFAEDLKVPP